jgi:hypothetical protein
MSRISSRTGWRSRSRSIHFPDSFANMNDSLCLCGLIGCQTDCRVKRILEIRVSVLGLRVDAGEVASTVRLFVAALASSRHGFAAQFRVRRLLHGGQEGVRYPDELRHAAAAQFSGPKEAIIALINGCPTNQSFAFR